MDGLCRVAGGLVDVTLGGREYMLRPLVLRDFATVEFCLLARSVMPLEAAAKVLPILAGQPEARRQLLERARKAGRTEARYSRKTWEDVLGWIETPEGVIYTGWLCLLAGRGRRPLTTLGAARRLFARASEDERAEFVRRRNLVSGLDDSACVDWPQPRAKPKAMPAEPGTGGRTSKDELDILLAGADPATAARLRRQNAEAEEREKAAKAAVERFSPWKKAVVNLLNDAYGFDFDAVAGLTLYQYRLARAGPGEVTGVVRMSRADAQAYRQMLQGG